ncbi:hypothetical protein [uncultured Sphaerochaeta sp.]|uniref:hypothetical protein n=1 Tax=uncultured Sphaerochaeta sp. TaxID=886478 RepID=UPI002A0A3BCB|nr:hypothetical protein [uncultured Sphaerochaeta sp.]
MLVDTHGAIEGKFLPSSFNNESLARTIEKYGWHSQEVQMCLSVNAKNSNHEATKTELFAGNYDFASGHNPFALQHHRNSTSPANDRNYRWGHLMNDEKNDGLESRVEHLKTE